MRRFFVSFVVVLVVGVFAIAVLRNVPNPTYRADPRDPQLVAQGQLVYNQYCASCHGGNLEGQPNWKQTLPEGGRPAPPHDATGHTWHHSDELLFDIVKRGPEAMASTGSVYRMPAFGHALSDEEIWAVLAYIKITWPPDILAAQEQISRQSR
ncbi:MAG TPA: cytochrome c [Roseiflexaceae bacterium]|nr:cytochrome c [Roseiflexaceae bacterium]